MKISYEYKIEKIAFINDGKQNIPVGVVEQNERSGDTVKMTIKFFKHIPKDLVDLLVANPVVMNFKETKLKADPVVCLPEGGDLLL